MQDHEPDLAPEPVQSLPAPAEHPELFPLTNFAGLCHGPARAESSVQVRLETTGVTSQFRQAELFSVRLIHKQSIALKLREVGCLDIAEILQNCHSRKGFAECQGCRKTRVFWNRCDNFFCPACQPHLSADRAEAIEWWTHEVKQPKHVVLTARNSDTITFARVAWFKSCIGKLRRSKLARSWRGGTWALEVTNEGRGWHLHAHMLIDADYIEKSALALKWAKLVGQDFAIVAIKDARGKSYLKEVTKYAVKGSQLAKWTGLDIAAFIHAFQGHRTFGVWGSLYGKRTEWAEWLKSISSKRGTCECGCDRWKIFDEDSWEAHLIELEAKSGKSSNPPPMPTQPGQVMQFRFVARMDEVSAIR